MARHMFTRKLEAVSQLEDNWDGEGAPRPSSDAIERAAGVLRWAEAGGTEVIDVDADVLGGVAVHVRAAWPYEHTIWIVCMDTGSDNVVWSAASKVIGHSSVDATSWGDLDRVLRTIVL